MDYDENLSDEEHGVSKMIIHDLLSNQLSLYKERVIKFRGARGGALFVCYDRKNSTWAVKKRYYLDQGNPRSE